MVCKGTFAGSGVGHWNKKPTCRAASEYHVGCRVCRIRLSQSNQACDDAMTVKLSIMVRSDLVVPVPVRPTAGPTPSSKRCFELGLTLAPRQSSCFREFQLIKSYTRPCLIAFAVSALRALPATEPGFSFHPRGHLISTRATVACWLCQHSAGQIAVERQQI